MTIPEFLDFIQLIESKLKTLDTQVFNCSQEQRDVLGSRCERDKIEIHADSINLSSIEQSPHYCLTVALGSYLLHLNDIFSLGLPTELQDWLFYESVQWIQGNLERENQIEQSFLQYESDWLSWVTTNPKHWSPSQKRRLSEGSEHAFTQVKNILSYQNGSAEYEAM